MNKKQKQKQFLQQNSATKAPKNKTSETKGNVHYGCQGNDDVMGINYLQSLVRYIQSQTSLVFSCSSGSCVTKKEILPAVNLFPQYQKKS